MLWIYLPWIGGTQCGHGTPSVSELASGVLENVRLGSELKLQRPW